jgi:hypothetical protein
VYSWINYSFEALSEISFNLALARRYKQRGATLYSVIKNIRDFRYKSTCHEIAQGHYYAQTYNVPFRLDKLLQIRKKQTRL